MPRGRYFPAIRSTGFLSMPISEISPEPRVLYTIGHSTRSLDDFIALLKAHGVTQLADIRTVPRSRRHPHFGSDALWTSLPAAGIAYRHCPGLGGRRKARPDSA